MEERRLVPGTVVFVIKNIKFCVLYLSYSTIPGKKVLSDTSRQKVLSHTSRVSSRPRTRILELRLTLALSLSLSLSLSLTLAHHGGGAVRRESSCHRASTPRHPLAGPSLPL